MLLMSRALHAILHFMFVIIHFVFASCCVQLVVSRVSFLHQIVREDLKNMAILKKENIINPDNPNTDSNEEDSYDESDFSSEEETGSDTKEETGSDADEKTGTDTEEEAGSDTEEKTGSHTEEETGSVIKIEDLSTKEQITLAIFLIAFTVIYLSILDILWIVVQPSSQSGIFRTIAGWLHNCLFIAAVEFEKTLLVMCTLFVTTQLVLARSMIRDLRRKVSELRSVRSAGAATPLSTQDQNTQTLKRPKTGNQQFNSNNLKNNRLVQINSSRVSGDVQLNNDQFNNRQVQITSNQISGGVRLKYNTFNNCQVHINSTCIGGGFSLEQNMFNNCQVHITSNQIRGSFSLEQNTFNNCQVHVKSTYISGGFDLTRNIFKNSTLT